MEEEIKSDQKKFNSIVGVVVVIAVIVFSVTAYFIYQSIDDNTDTNLAASNENVTANVNSIVNSEVSSTPDTQEACEAQGGRWHVWNFWQGDEPECDMPWADGSTVCTDLSDCESELCMYMEENPIVNTEVIGMCASWHSDSCVTHNYFVQQGKVIKEVCKI